jgi:hypothetical protein
VSGGTVRLVQWLRLPADCDVPDLGAVVMDADGDLWLRVASGTPGGSDWAQLATCTGGIVPRDEQIPSGDFEWLQETYGPLWLLVVDDDHEGDRLEQLATDIATPQAQGRVALGR